MQRYDHLIKVILVGDSGVGKSAIVRRFSKQRFDVPLTPTIGVDFEIVHVNVDGQDVKLQCWDCAGSERFRSITSSYFRGAHVALVVFDVNDEKSFASVPVWIDHVQKVNPEAVIWVVGNKLDSRKPLDVPLPEDFRAELKRDIIYTSAKSNCNVDVLFRSVARERVRNGTKRLLTQSGAAVVPLTPSLGNKSCCLSG